MVNHAQLNPSAGIFLGLGISSRLNGNRKAALSILRKHKSTTRETETANKPPSIAPQIVGRGTVNNIMLIAVFIGFVYYIKK